MNLSLSEQLSYSTVKIECDYTDGKSGSGTGYFINFKENNGTAIPVVITNKHVIDGSIRGRLVFCKKSSGGTPLDQDHFIFNIEDFEEGWTKHPDANVDLCAMPIAQIINEAKKSNENLFYIPLQTSLIPDDYKFKNFSLMEEIVMVGYPIGLWDKINNKPIFRKGVSATHPAYDYNGRKEFVIDAACYPGSSGSPVFLLNENGYGDKNGNMTLGKRIFLLGTLYAGPQYTATGEIKIMEIPTGMIPITESSIPMNLGYVIKSERILELEKLF